MLPTGGALLVHAFAVRHHGSSLRAPETEVGAVSVVGVRTCMNASVADASGCVAQVKSRIESSSRPEMSGKQLCALPLPIATPRGLSPLRGVSGPLPEFCRGKISMSHAGDRRKRISPALRGYGARRPYASNGAERPLGGVLT